MGRLLFGLIKGAVIGGGVGYGAFRLGLPSWTHWLLYGLVGLLVGLLVGRPVWAHLVDKKSTVWTGILKGIFGFGLGVGLWAIGAKAVGNPTIALAGEVHTLTAWTPIFGALVGLVYGTWVELDDPPLRKVDKQTR